MLLISGAGSAGGGDGRRIGGSIDAQERGSMKEEGGNVCPAKIRRGSRGRVWFGVQTRESEVPYRGFDEGFQFVYGFGPSTDSDR
jgi:hypothetical protein